MHDIPLTFECADGWVRRGFVVSVTPHSIVVRAPGLAPGAAVAIDRRPRPPLLSVAVSVTSDQAICAPLQRADAVVPGAGAVSSLGRPGAYVGAELLGRSVDAWGRCEQSVAARIALANPPPLPLLERGAIERPLRTGDSAVDAFVTLGRGQRVGLFAGAGIGKTTLLRRIVNGSAADARVVALVGERGREAAEIVAEFGRSERFQTTTVVCATAEAPPLERIAAAQTATAQAEALAEDGRDVLLVVD